jgi:hypothetical protein
MDSEFAKLHDILLIKLREPQITRNADGTLNKQGVVTHKAVVNLGINGKEEPMMMLSQENKTKHLNVCFVQHRLEEGSEVV